MAVAIEGNLSYFPIVEILYLLSRFRKTGRVTIKEGGNIYISDGRVIHADTDSSEGMDAFFALSMIKEGHFNFQPDEKPRINTISQTLSNLLESVETIEAELKEFERELPPLATVLEKSSKTPDGDKIALKKDDWKILILADGERTLEQIINASLLDKLNTYRSLSWLFKKGLLYDPKEKNRVVTEGIDKAKKFLEVFGDGPWREALDNFLKERELESAITLTDNNLLLHQNNFPLDLEKSREFFENLMNILKSEATKSLGRMLVNKKMEQIK